MLAVLYGRHQFAEQSKLLRSRDSLKAAVAAFRIRHDSLVRVDTLRETHIVALRSKADTLIKLVTERTRDTLILNLVDSAQAAYRAALDSAQVRVAFWRAAYDSVVMQRDRGLNLLNAVHAPTRWAAAVSVDQLGGVNVCGLRNVTHILGVGLSVGICWRR